MEEKIINSTSEEVANTAEETNKDASEKKFTQEDVDRIIQKKTAKHYEKLADFQKLSKILAEKGGVSGETPAEQIAFLNDYYGESGNGQAEHQSAEKPDDTKSYVKALRFKEKASDEDVYDEVQRILSTPVKNRDSEDLALLEVLGTRYGQIAFKKEYDEAKDNYDGNLDELLKDKEFKEFAEGSNLPLKRLVAKYVKLTGIKEKKQNHQSKSMGSVKNSGAAVAKDYYTPEEVDRLTDKDYDDPKIMAAVRKSMTKWKK